MCIIQSQVFISVTFSSFKSPFFEAEKKCDVKEEMDNVVGDEYKEMFEDEALLPLSNKQHQDTEVAMGHDAEVITPSQIPEQQINFTEVAEDEVPKPGNVILVETPESGSKDDSSKEQDDAEGRFGRYLAEKMRMVPKERQFDAEFAVLGALREFIPR